MKRTKQLEREVQQVIDAYWGNYISGNVQAMLPLLDEAYTQVGSAESEVFFNKQDAVTFLYETIGEVAGKVEMRNRMTTVEPLENLILVSDLCDLYVLHADEWIFYAKFRASSLLQKKKGDWKIIHQHSSFADARTEEGGNLAIEDLAAENVQLREAVKRRTVELEHKNRALEIETALERVRGVAMAMRQPDDLSGISETVFTELKALGFMELRNTEIIINHDAAASITSYYYSDYGVTGVIDVEYTMNPTVAAWARDMQKADDAFAEIVISENEIEAWRAYRVSIGYVPDPKLDQATTVYYYSYAIGLGALSISSFKPVSAEQLKVLERFRNVFSLSYQRYTDIALAEAQAREAQIEAALERMRAKTMAMHKSDELRSVIAVVFEQLKGLGFDAPACGLIIFDKDTGDAVNWLSGFGKEIFPVGYHIPHFDHPYYQEWLHAWKSGEPYKNFIVEGDLKKSFDDYLFEHSDFKNIPLEIQNEFRKVERAVSSNAFMKHGMLGVLGAEEAIGQTEKNIIQRFAKVFDQTYTRFLDLKKAEAQARQAVQQASLDRVRAEIASMRTAADLQHITPLIWRELITLGVPFFRCGVFIIDDATEQVHVYLSTSSGEAVAALDLKFDRAPVVQAAVQHWRQQTVYCETWNREQFIAWTQLILQQGLIDNPEQYQAGGAAPETLALQFVPFTQGMLYVGSTASLPDDQINLVQALAGAFSVAYARYEDFIQLEAAKAKVEGTLADLKTTQAQLIQAEKMASLGQLTAGIAHEIKNPLNFVNNFAEVNEELADELLDALQNGEDLEAIIADLKQNAHVIAQHGKRADGIVHAMMQHASGGTGRRETTDVNTLVSEHIDLAYHGKRAQVPDLQVEIERDLSEETGVVDVVPQEIGRVLLNLLGNAFDAIQEHAVKVDGAEERVATRPYTPAVRISTKRLAGQVEIRVSDNGPGIPATMKGKIFEPFFTTKPTGSGTGLGLSLSYDIVTQGHGGTLTVESTEGEGATFIVTLPVNRT